MIDLKINGNTATAEVVFNDDAYGSPGNLKVIIIVEKLHDTTITDKEFKDGWKEAAKSLPQ